MNKGEQVYREASQLNSETSTMSVLHQELKRMYLPEHADVTTQSSPGKRNGRRRYTSVGVHANELLAASMHSNLTSDARQWFTLGVEDEDLNKRKAVKDWFTLSGRILYRHLDNSNFSGEIHGAYLYLGALGTSAMFIGQRAPTARDGSGFPGLTFHVWPIREYAFKEDANGIVDSVYREYALRADQIMARWGKHPLFRGMPEHMTKAMTSENPAERNKRHELVHCFRPRAKYDPDGKGVLNMPYEALVVCKKTKKVIVETGFEEFPLAVPRWDKSPDDIGWGRSPGMKALADIQSLNQAKYLSFKAWAKDVDPPIVVDHKGVIGNLRTHAGGVTYKRRGSSLDYLQSGARWDVSKYNEETVKREIERHFFVDQLELKDSPAMTATEAQIRYELMMKLLGPTYGRLKRELFNVIIHRCLNILNRAGQLPEMPPELVDAIRSENAPSLDVQYNGPLARAQRQDDVVAIERTLQSTIAIAEKAQRPELLDNFKIDESIQYIAEINGYPSDLMNSLDEVDANRKQREEQMKKMQEREQMSQDVDDAKTASEINPQNIVALKEAISGQ